MTPVSHGKPCAGNPHARFDEGASASEEPRRKALLHTRIAKLAMSALGAVALCGCVATNVPPPDRRVTIAEDLGTSVYITDIRCAKGASDYATLQTNVVNNTSSDLAIEWKVVWLDADGVAIDSLVSTWNKLMLAPNDVSALKNTAPRTDAADMLFYLRRMR